MCIDLSIRVYLHFSAILQRETTFVTSCLLPWTIYPSKTVKRGGLGANLKEINFSFMNRVGPIGKGAKI